MKIYDGPLQSWDWVTELKADPTLGMRVLQQLNQTKTDLVEKSGELFSRKIAMNTIDKVMECGELRKTTLDRFGELFAAYKIELRPSEKIEQQEPIVPDQWRLKEDQEPVIQPKKAIFGRSDSEADGTFTRMRIRSADLDYINAYCIENNVANRFALIERCLQIGFKAETNQKLPSDQQPNPSAELVECGLMLDDQTSGLILDDEPAQSVPAAGFVMD